MGDNEALLTHRPLSTGALQAFLLAAAAERELARSARGHRGVVVPSAALFSPVESAEE